MPSFKTVQFGVLEYLDSDIILIPDGLIGMTGLRRWLLLAMGDELPMQWLQSLDRDDFGVPVMAPHFFTDDYEVDLPAVDRESLRNDRPEHLVTLVIATIHAGGERITANLRAPLVMDSETRRGVQIALNDDRLTMRQDIDSFKFGLAVQGIPAENGASEVTASTDPALPETAAASL